MSAKKITRSHYRWTTTDELKFIDNLGRYTLTATTRAELLKKYSNAMKLRDNWGDVDKSVIMDNVYDRLGGE